MASKGNNRHVKRLAATRYVRISRKSSEFVSKPNAGRYTYDSSISLITVLKEKLGIANTSKEARKILKSNGVLVNTKQIKEEKYPVGTGDVICIVNADEYYRIIPGKKGIFSMEKIEKKDASKTTLKVVNKYVAKGKKLMIQLNDGTILAAPKDAKVNDSVVLDKGKATSVIKFAEGANCMVLKGVHSPRTGTIKSIVPGTARKAALVEIESKEGAFETTINNVMVM